MLVSPRIVVCIFLFALFFRFGSNISAADPLQSGTASATEVDPLSQLPTDLTADDSNVILGRELVNVIKGQEFLVLIQQQILAINSQVSSTIQEVQDLSVLKSDSSGAKTRSTSQRESLSDLQKQAALRESDVLHALYGNSQEGALAPSIDEDQLKTLSGNVASLDSAIFKFEREVVETSKELSGHLRKAVRTKQEWDREQLYQQNAARSLAILEGTLSMAHVALPQFASGVSVQAIPQFMSYPSSDWSDDNSFESTMSPAAVFPVQNSSDAPDQIQLKNMLSTIQEQLIPRLQKQANELKRMGDSIARLEETVIEISVKSSAVTKVAQENEALKKTLLAKVQGTIEKNQYRKARLEKALGTRDAVLNQYQINQLLVYAVYGMIASIIGSFILLRVYPSSLTGLVLEQRIIVEVLSMGFLLVTVIILGSAKIITGEGLAGLLGTIAGYIFVKKTSENMGSGRDTNSDSILDRAHEAAQVELANVKAAAAELRHAVGDSPTEANKKKIAIAESRVQRAEIQVQSLAKAIASRNNSPPPEPPESDQTES